MPREVQLSVFENPVLTTADRVCLALTCKAFAGALSKDRKLLTFPETIKHGEEDSIHDLAPSKPVDDASAEEINEWMITRKKIDYEHRSRIDHPEIESLFTRLNEG